MMNGYRGCEQKGTVRVALGHGGAGVVLSDWFLRADERGNSATSIDSARAGMDAWTEGNDVSALVHGSSYFEDLVAELSMLVTDDAVHFTDWRGDADERLRDAGPEVGALLGDLVRRGVDVRGLVWRSHADRLAFSAKENRFLADEVSQAGGEVLLDERVRWGGSHHQKLVVLRHPDAPHADVGFVGGIDLCHGRRDDGHHHGDDQAIPLDKRYGPHPPWHDLQIKVRGPAVSDLDFTFRERWEDPTPLNYSNVWRAWLTPRRRATKPLPDALSDPPHAGPHAVQVLRTYPYRRPPYPFAPQGERSIARAYAKAFPRARRLIYVEDQFFWSTEIAGLLAETLKRNPDLRVIAVVPRHPEKDGRISGPPNRIGQQQAMALIGAAGGDRVAFYDLENQAGSPIYVHAKVCVIDDVWASVGSDNLNRRSWTHDSEIACAVIDQRLDHRPPADPGGLGDGARGFARDLRLQLWAEHLRTSPANPDLLDPARGFAVWRETAATLEAWHDTGQRGTRPPGQVRPHHVAPIGAHSRWWADFLYRTVYDPDGRPQPLRRDHRF